MHGDIVEGDITRAHQLCVTVYVDGFIDGRSFHGGARAAHSNRSLHPQLSRNFRSQSTILGGVGSFRRVSIRALGRLGSERRGHYVVLQPLII